MFEISCFCKEHCHANVGTCCLHALYESVGGLSCGGNVINDQDILSTEEILVDVVALVCSVCEFMHMADMNFLSMSVNDDMTEPVHGSEALRKLLREALVADVVSTLAAGRSNPLKREPLPFPLQPNGWRNLCRS